MHSDLQSHKCSDSSTWSSNSASASAKQEFEAAMKFKPFIGILLLLATFGFALFHTDLRATGRRASSRTSVIKLDPSNSKPPLSPFDAAYAEVLRMRDRSMYFVQTENRMPLMRLDERERDRSYRVRMGRQWMRSRNVVFAATTRNCKPELTKSIAEYHKLGKLFNDYWLIFVENDSEDGTREFLHDSVYRNYKKTLILGCDPVNSRAPCRLNIRYASGKAHKPNWDKTRTEQDRVDRGIVMSAMRNLYLDYIYDHFAHQADLLIVVEPDLYWSPWNLDNIPQGMYYFSAKPKLDNLCANARYDNALFDPCGRTYFSKKRYGSVTEQDRSYITDEIALDNNKLPVKVLSCFNGFSIYRISSLAKKRLHHHPVPVEQSCEHNTLARRLREIYIDPEMRLNIL